MSAEFSRRRFLGVGVAGGIAGALGGASQIAGAESAGAPAGSATGSELPRRKLGKTGVEVTVLGLGTAPMGEGPPRLEDCVRVYSEAIDLGISYVDTARIYGKAEDALGEVLRPRRDKVFLATKCMVDDAAKAQESFEESLRRMRVDHVDLLHLHSCGDRDLDKVLAAGGVWDYFKKMKEQGKTRFIGITGHNRPKKFIRMLETGQVDVMMVAMNFADRYTYGFEGTVLPVALKHGTGVMAMKVYGGIRGGFAYIRQRRPSQLDEIHLQNAVRYGLSIEGVTGLVIGVHDLEELRQNIAFVSGFTPLSAKEKAGLERLGQRLATEWGPRWGPVEA